MLALNLLNIHAVSAWIKPHFVQLVTGRWNSQPSPVSAWLSCPPATNSDKPAGYAEISWCKGLTLTVLYPGWRYDTWIGFSTQIRVTAPQLGYSTWMGVCYPNWGTVPGLGVWSPLGDTELYMIRVTLAVPDWVTLEVPDHPAPGKSKRLIKFSGSLLK